MISLAFAATACTATDPVVPPSPPASCNSNVVPLVTTRIDGVADSQVVPVVVDGVDAWLAVDTGSQNTFVFREDFEESAAVVVIGCEERTVIGFGADAIGVEDFDGKPILGILGLDFFGQVGEIDYPGGTITRHTSLPASAELLPSSPFTIVDHRALVDVVIDDLPLKMMLDTGAPNTLWVGVERNNGDEEGQIQTADGSIWDVWWGDGDLELGGERRVVPITRALDVAYIGPELDELGAQGLLGVTSLGWRRILWDASKEQIYFGARP